MRSAILTNTSVGAANGTPNPQSAANSAQIANSNQGAAQISHVAAAQNTKMLAQDRAVALEKRTEASFDKQKYDTENEEQSEIKGSKKSYRDDSESGRLLTVA